MNSKMNELQLKEKACKSLLANVLDMDDDLRYLTFAVIIPLTLVFNLKTLHNWPCYLMVETVEIWFFLFK